jgi:diacylglycerol O-acyltransferase
MQADRQRKRMGSADAAWLHMDRAGNLMQVNSLMWTDEPIDVNAVRDLTEHRLLAEFPKFRQRILERPPWGIWWEDDPGFDIAHHVIGARLPAPGGRAELQEFVSARMGERLDRSRPLWRTYVVDGYGTGSAVLSQMHHCIADGIALARVLLSLTDGSDQVVIAPALAGPERSPLHPARIPGTAVRLIRDGVEWVQHPGRIADVAREVFDDGRSAVRLVALPPDRNPLHHSHLTGERRAAWRDPLPLSEVKALARSYDATVNDVLLATMSGALHHHLIEQGLPPHDLRAIVPFNVRPIDAPLPRELGNRFGLVFLDLPVGCSDPVVRVAEVRRRMTQIKRSSEGKVSFGILQGVGLTPSRLEKAVVDLFSAKGSAVMTNVVGPEEQVYFAGSPVRGVIPWVPTSGNVGIGVSIFSYHGEVVVGLSTDAGVVPVPDRVLDAFGMELEALQRLQRRPVSA